MPKNVNKASAIKKITEKLNLNMDQVMAFGDAQNDIEMLKQVKIGVAMENGHESVKEAADYITKTNNEAGVAKAICHFTGIQI